MSAATRAGISRVALVEARIAKINPKDKKSSNSTHKRGELHPNTIVSRLPNGMPIKRRENTSIRFGHRLGSRLRNRTQKFLQKGRQLERRNPAQAALRHAPVRNYEVENNLNVLRSEKFGWTNAHNIVQEPLEVNFGVLGNIPNPIAEGTRVQNGRYSERPRVRENQLSFAARPVLSAATRLMTAAELVKEERFRQQEAEEAQRRARALYRSPRNISRSPRKVKSITIKKPKHKLKKRSL
jgi:hypothetical protein